MDFAKPVINLKVIFILCWNRGHLQLLEITGLFAQIICHLFIYLFLEMVNAKVIKFL